jgi:hypothetical protein
MTLVRARVRGVDLVRAKVNDSGLTNRRAEGAELALPYVAKLEPLGFRVSCSHLVGIEPRPPDDHIIGFRRGIFVELRQTLRRDDPSKPALATLGSSG